MLTDKTSIEPNVLFLLCDFQVSDLLVLDHRKNEDNFSCHILNIIGINIGVIITSLHTMKYR